MSFNVKLASVCDVISHLSVISEISVVSDVTVSPVSAIAVCVVFVVGIKYTQKADIAIKSDNITEKIKPFLDFNVLSSSILQTLPLLSFNYIIIIILIVGKCLTPF